MFHQMLGGVAEKDRQSVPLSQKAYELIKRQIVDLELPPGSIIDENRLQDELELGRTPIREALLRLSLENLVTIVPRRGIFVTDIGIADLQQIFEMRIELESLAVRLAALRGSDEHWGGIEFEIKKLYSQSPRDSDDVLAIDKTCHYIIYDAANNRFLKDTLIGLYTLSQRLWRYLAPSPADTFFWLVDYENLLEALRARDAEKACQLIEDHVFKFQESIQSAVLLTPGIPK